MQKLVRSLVQEAVVTLARPPIAREVRGWGKLFDVLVGNYRRNWLWQDAPRRTIRGKVHNLLMELDLSQWNDRMTFFLGRWYDLGAQTLVREALSEGDEVLDIGANVGMFTLAAMHQVGNAGFVHAVEPNPNPRAQLERNLALNAKSNVRVYPIALSDAAGQLELFVPHVNSGEGSLAPLRYTADQCYTVAIEAKVGDQVFASVNPRMIKIDVEGAELSVLRGLSGLIKRSKPLLIAEYIPDHLERFGSTIGDMFDFARDHGYKVYDMREVRTDAGWGMAFTQVMDASSCSPSDLLLCHQDDPFQAKIAAMNAARRRD